MQSPRPLRIGVIGVGALGTTLLSELAVQSRLHPYLGDVHLIDPDTLDDRNLALSPTFASSFQQLGPAVLGQAKTMLAANSLRLTAPAVRWISCSSEFADLSWATLACLDLLIGCVDNALTRTEIAFAARALGLPFLDGAVLGSGPEGEPLPGGRVTWFPPSPEAACYLCGLSTVRRADLLAYAATPSLGCHAPVLTPMGAHPASTASLQGIAKALFTAIVDLARPTTRFHAPRTAFAFRPSPLSSESGTPAHKLQRSSSCPWHSPPLPLASIEPDQPFADILAAQTRAGGMPSARLQFAWPVCLQSRCLHCGGQNRTVQRLAVLRRRARCPACGTPHQLEPLQTLTGIGHNDPVASSTPRQLGWNDRQLLQLRPALQPATLGKEHP